MSERMKFESEQEKLRGVSDSDVYGLSDMQLIMLGLSMLLRQSGIQDEFLIDTLWSRGKAY